MVKIAIVGGGWVGCNLALKLKDKFSITLYEKNEELMTETSTKNQNRLHLGYHYARSGSTRKLCKETFFKFIEEYGFLTKEIQKNLYCVSKDSVLDFETFNKIFDDYDTHRQFDSDIENVEGSILTKERYIDFNESKNFFNYELKNVSHFKKIDSISNIKNNYDLVINSTNNYLNRIDSSSFYELTLTLLYRKKKNTSFDSLTIIDGNFFSIFPYMKDIYTLTDVEHTPIEKFFNIKELENYSLSEEIIKSKINFMQSKVNKYYKDFLNDFEYENYFLATKTKHQTSSANRYPIIHKSDNVINCYTGKIQGIYPIEKYIKDLLC